VIVVTLGTQFFPFDRCATWVARLLAEGIIAEPVLFQHGATSVDRLSHPLLTPVYSIDLDEMQRAIRRSRLVISHAGQGSARMLARLGARFVLLPRRRIHGEHVDDHQLLFTQAVARLGVHYCTEYNQLVHYVENPPPPLSGDLFEQTPSLADHLALRFN
jgi:UDP-N-acetylglucosamine transferase subunit ALG13